MENGYSNAGGCQAVSYTHLDVYKRQVLMIVTITYKAVLVVIGIVIWIFGRGFLEGYLGPVSYTHLDVYKRQA